jgi:c-di-GMP-binding flagellar brake protein YcgR
MNDIQKQKHNLKERRKNIRSSGSDEKRDYIRTDIYVPMFLYVQSPEGSNKVKEGSNKVKARTCNISASGMMVELDTDLPVGAKTKIEIIAPSTSNPIHCIGQIVWCTASGSPSSFNCGVEFVSIEEDNKNTFLKFLCDLIYKTSDENETD